MTTFKSRWGFHPCDYETFRKLKTIHKWYYKALHDYAKWERWYRKEPQNRVIRCWIRNAAGNKIGSRIVEIQQEPLFFYLGAGQWRRFTSDYQNARQPVEEKNVLPLRNTLSEIDDLYNKLKAWTEANGRTL